MEADGHTILSYAAHRGRHEIVEILLDAGFGDHNMIPHALRAANDNKMYWILMKRVPTVVVALFILILALVWFHWQ